VLPSSLNEHLSHDEVNLGALRTDERISEILNDSKESKVEDSSIRNYRPEDFLMLLPQEQQTNATTGEYVSGPPNPFQSACTMCPNL